MTERNIDWNQAREIAEGVDSVVYLFNDRTVLKHYVWNSHSLDSILRYQELTNAASRWLQDNPRTGSLSFGGETWRLETEIVPIWEVLMSDGYPVGISEYIPGPKLDTMYGSAAPVIGEFGALSDDERNFLLKLRESLKSGEVCGQFYRYLRPLEGTLMKAMYVKGILIPSINIKVKANVEQKRIKLIATDVSDAIGSLSYSKTKWLKPIQSV